MEILLVLVVGILILTAFYMGFIFGSKEKVFTPKEKIKETIENVKTQQINKTKNEEEKIKEEELKKELENIDSYSGTEIGQEEL